MTNPASASITCGNCGASTSGKFCHNCGSALPSGRCVQCDAELPAGARFCNECGTPTTAGAAPAPRANPPRAASAAPRGGPNAEANSPVATYGPWALAAVLLVAVIVYFRSSENQAPTTAEAGPMGAAPVAPFANGGGGGGAPPDISSMTPRERSQRLFDRVMRYAAEGKKDSLMTFAPMAMASFEMMGADLDLDGRYDLSRIALEAGQVEVAVAQADTILQKAPTHLLGLALKARTAALKGDNAGSAKALAAFASAQSSELAKKLPEYEMHAADIAQTAAMAKGGK